MVPGYYRSSFRIKDQKSVFNKELVATPFLKNNRKTRYEHMEILLILEELVEIFQ